MDDRFGLGSRLRVGSLDPAFITIDDRPFLRALELGSPPESPPDRWLGLIGEYDEDGVVSPAGDDHQVLYVLERDGRLHCLIEWFYLYPLTEVSRDVFAFPDHGLYPGEQLVFTRDASDRGISLVAAEVPFRRRPIEPEDGNTFRIEPLRPTDELREEALAATPPPRAPDLLEPDLVDLASFGPELHHDIRYATTNNFVGSIFYEAPKAYAQRPAAEALWRAHRRFKAYGYGVLLHDTYRPWFVTKMFWDATPESMRDFVANPERGSRHNRGCAVDLSLYDLRTGLPVTMVGGYDEFTQRSFPHYPGGTDRQRWLRDLLRRVMESEGFRVYEYEWWHFDHADWERYPVLNLTFTELSRRDRTTGTDPAGSRGPR